MRLPKTVKGYISLIRQIEKKGVATLKGFESLSNKNREVLTTLDAEISNLINEIDEEE